MSSAPPPVAPPSPGQTPSTTCSLSPSSSLRKPKRIVEDEPECMKVEEQASSGALLEMKGYFTQPYTAPADGYLTAGAGDAVDILYKQDDWYFGRTDAQPSGGWFPVVSVLYDACLAGEFARIG